MIKFSITKTEFDSIRKFTANKIIFKQTLSFDREISQNSDDSLIREISSFPFIKKIVANLNNITIEIDENINWEDLENDFIDLLQNFYSKKRFIPEVYMETTPNDRSLKFVCNKNLSKRPIELNDSSDIKSPLLKEIFKTGNIDNILIKENNITISISKDESWDLLKLEIRELIKSQLEELDTENLIELSSSAIQSKKENPSELDDISTKIIELIDTEIQPYVNNDGGHIDFHSYDKESKNVKLILKGACSGCPSASVTLKNGVEQLLKSELPNLVETVESIDL